MKERRLGLLLGWRWFVRPASADRGLRWRRVAAAALATWVAVLGAALWQANDDRADRGRAQEPSSDPYLHDFEAFQTDNPYHGDVWTTIFMGGIERDADAATVTPPGVPRFLAPGETYVSPAVRRALARDPLAAGRVPGRVTGSISEEGLQSPDQYLVYTGGVPGQYWRRASGWGSPAVAVARESIPRGPLLGTIGILVGVPSILLARASGRMSAISRQRSLAACHLLGIPMRALAMASGVDALLCGAAGALAGVLATVLTVLAVHDTRLLGIDWFPPDTIVPTDAALVTIVVLLAVVSRDAFRATQRDLQRVHSARAGGPRPTRRWAAVPLFLGVAGLAGIVFSYVVLDHRIRNTWAIDYLYLGVAMATIGALSGLPLLLDLWSRRLRRRQQRSTASFVAVRRLSWQRDAIGASCIGLTIVGLASLVGASVVTDLESMSTSHPAGDEWNLHVFDETELANALRVPNVTRMLQVEAEGGGSTDIADCPTLTKLVGFSSPTSGRRFTEQCRPGMTFRIAADGQPSAGRVVLPVYSGILNGATILALDPAQATLPPGQRDIVAFPGRSDSQVDEYVSRIAAIAPDVEISDLSADSFRPMVPPTRRLLLACMTAGLLTAAAMLVLGALDQRRRAVIDDARLIALGATRRLTARIHVWTFGRGAAAALGIGLLVGGLAGTVYDRVGGLVGGPGRLGVLFTALSMLIAALAVLLVWLTALPEHRGALSEELRRE